MLQIQKRNQNWLPNVFDEFLYNDNFSYRPLMNILETDDSYIIQIQATGFKKDEASISLDGDELMISLVNKDKNVSKAKFVRQEFAKKNYKQSFVISDGVDKAKISASLENGILIVSLPKCEPEIQQARQIQIC